MEENTNQLTVMSKTSQKIIFFHPSERLTIRYTHNQIVHSYLVAFDEVKMISNKPYYVFTIVTKEKAKVMIDNPRALFLNGNETGMLTILDFDDEVMEIETPHFFTKREVLIKYKSNNKLCEFTGKILWAKKNEERHCYGLFSL